jgi:hypothetical protein
MYKNGVFFSFSATSKRGLRKKKTAPVEHNKRGHLLPIKKKERERERKMRVAA